MSAKSPKPIPVEFGRALLPHLDPLHRRALRLASSPSLAEDLVQGTVERALCHASKFTVGSNMGAWLCAIMSNLHIDACRKRSRELLSRSGAQPDIAATEAEPRPAWEELSLKDVQRLIPRLNPDLRHAMSSFVEGTCSYRTISVQLGIPMSTVGTRLWRARRQLRTLLEEELSRMQVEGTPGDGPRPAQEQRAPSPGAFRRSMGAPDSRDREAEEHPEANLYPLLSAPARRPVATNP